MSDLNKAMVIGRLGKDPEVRATQGGTKVANFSVATSKKWKDKKGDAHEETQWHRIIAWGKLAEICEKYLKKGKQVYIEGELQTREWKDKEGVTKYTTEIVASNLQMLGNKDGGGEQPPHPAETAEEDGPL